MSEVIAEPHSPHIAEQRASVLHVLHVQRVLRVQRMLRVLRTPCVLYTEHPAVRFKCHTGKATAAWHRQGL